MNLSLAEIAYVIGGVFVLMNLYAILNPSAWCRHILAFPRSVWAGRVLTAVDLIWVASVVLNASLGRFEYLKPYVYIAVPVAYVLIIHFLDELLAPRVFGGFLLLIANPMLTVARWHPSPLRLVITVLAYIWVICGMVLMLSPFRFRKVTAYWVESETHCRIAGLAGLLLGCLILALGLFVY